MLHPSIRQGRHLHSLHILTLTCLNLHLNSGSISCKKTSPRVEKLSKSCYFPKAKPQKKQPPQDIMRRRKKGGNQLVSHCEWKTRASCSLDRLQQEYLTASVNTSHTWREAASIKHHARGNSSIQPPGETLETFSNAAEYEQMCPKSAFGV